MAFDRSRPAAGPQSGRGRIKGACAAVLVLTIAGCATWDCYELGIQPGSPAGKLRSINELPDSEIEKVCGQKKAGCVVPGSDGIALYYRNGDEYALRHELCHVMHGYRHTIEYQRRLIE